MPCCGTYLVSQNVRARKSPSRSARLFCEFSGGIQVICFCNIVYVDVCKICEEKFSNYL